ncbi:MAG: hydantoinase/oxoprolinase family protein [Alphaproteobacteria bacterium]|nr:hydantoinase/oxoprolinase family protein [Rhodospirillaceae bacterium]MBT6511267.1 hydantoinase/oxoprolinase family protein [Rhodospirillaceae bacterium]MBT7615083.1 hydantoinase/oxoprolinase family protein [Rhodospirillaceae bacterium]MBT7646358.1 hydantoinase/oxoprolinase family protein [Rhodospirillaceae bacterium]MDG2482288.1 hydantoinase/oxoprolinase family protein [Alphaproteobacteria bacterium]
MALTLGIDTGGTYTDAVLYDTERGVLADAKALTTKHDLTIGVAEAVDKVIGEHAGEIALVSISTTLATNAIVEGQGSPAALILIGHADSDRDRPDLIRALAGDPLITVQGGHDALGEERLPLGLAALRAEAEKVQGRVSAFAVSSLFAVRNPEHEMAARDMLREMTGLPVSCAHSLSSELDAPRRALTALLNARLIPLIQGLIVAVRDLMAERGVAAPIMVVKGDGSLIDATTALESPVETILSGPAASVVGAHHLSARDNAFVSDIGGTTTDIALVRDGKPLLDPQGARVGGYRTMVRAVAVHTSGLGGDSEIQLNDRGRIQVGPRRAVPLALLASRYPKALEQLKGQTERGWPAEYDGIFVLRQRRLDTDPSELTRPQHKLWESLADGPVPMDVLYRDQSPKLPLERLLDRGLVILSRFSPSDAAHVLGLHDSWDAEASTLGARLWIRWWAITGHAAPDDPAVFADMVVDATNTATTRALLEAATAEQHGLALPHGRAADALLKPALSGAASDLFDLSIRFHRPVVAVGAAAATYYPEVGRRLNTEAVIPPHADVCNAVGAVAGGIAQRVDALITAPSDGLYRCHLPEGIADFEDLDQAARHTEAEVSHRAQLAAETIGARDIAVQLDRHDEIVRGKDGSKLFIESRISALATGRPALAHD